MERPLTRHINLVAGPLSLGDYQRSGGYETAKQALLKLTPAEITQTIKDAGLLGRGGAGFNSGIKMAAVPMGDNAPKQKYLVVNADEMEPGTFKDRLLLEGNPHQLIEGMIIAAYAIQASVAYIFLRGEYKLAQRYLQKAVDEAYKVDFLGKSMMGLSYDLEIYIHMSAGRYICGEETALINALEGKRAIPRAKPPFLQTSGLWGKPTLVQNVETLCNFPHIIQHGADWYKSLGKAIDAGTKIFGVSGRVKNPGAWELPMGTTARELIEVHAGGMQEGYRLRAFLPGGASTDFLTESHLDVPLDYSSMAKAGTRMGTGTVIVLDDRTCPVGALLSLESFFKQESCGFCSPCREGLSWISDILSSYEQGVGKQEDFEVLKEHAKRLSVGSTFCALAPGAASPLWTGLCLFQEDFQRHVAEKRCFYSSEKRV